MKALPALERPREKLILNGPDALTDCELLALLMGSGSREKPVMALCEALLDRYGHNLTGLAAATADELCAIRGIGAAKATQLVAAMELGRRQAKQANTALCLSGEEVITELLQPYFSSEAQLRYILLLADRHNHLLATCELRTENGWPEVSEIIRLVLEAGAVTFGLVRNDRHRGAEWLSAEEQILRGLGDAAALFGFTWLGRIIQA